LPGTADEPQPELKVAETITTARTAGVQDLIRPR